jgi:hypothetical protein
MFSTFDLINKICLYKKNKRDEESNITINILHSIVSMPNKLDEAFII